jgi:DNA ligase-1
VLFDELAAASETVAGTAKRNDKVRVLADVLGRLDPAEIVPATAMLVGTTPHGRIGVGWASLSAVRAEEPAESASLTVREVAAAIDALAAMSGDGVVAARRRVLGELFARATAREQRLLVGVLGGELRQGALDGVLTSAVAAAASVPVAAVRRAAMMSGDPGLTARAALTAGRAGLEAITLEPSRPIQPMLASPADGIEAAVGDRGPVVVEAKLDGARVQAHRRDGTVRLFTRNLNEVTDRLPGVVSVVESLPGGDLVLDGEVLGVLADGSPRRFQDTMGDFGADGVAGRGSELRAFFFDVMYANGAAVHDEPLSLRREVLGSVVPAPSRLASITTADVDEARAFLDATVRQGHEGVMVKDLDQPYAAGRRGAAWRKVKPVHTLDLVVLAVEWGHGRRTGWLSNLHLGARATDGGRADGGFVMVGKTFKGLTDELLRWQTERFLELEIGREGHVVHVRPEQVVEVAVDGVQVSTRYPGGVALRFARVRRYRDDKRATDADTIDAVRALL